MSCLIKDKMRRTLNLSQTLSEMNHLGQLLKDREVRTAPCVHLTDVMRVRSLRRKTRRLPSTDTGGSDGVKTGRHYQERTQREKDPENTKDKKDEDRMRLTKV